ncbi:MAG TPA: PhzF family phenazine biosynthesis protein, partial [Arthrobacter sp.]|nr:PhzF family phenazine biosynthesis protein [Arthrobacter sp.]
RERLADLDYNFDDLLTLMTAREWTTVQLFWQENEHTFHARDPFPVGGVVEDPATGAAAAALGGYFRALGLVSGTRQFTIHQGVDMGRPSELAVVVHPDDPRVTVSGYAVPIPN